jgi:hypothetical protein
MGTASAPKDKPAPATAEAKQQELAPLDAGEHVEASEPHNPRLKEAARKVILAVKSEQAFHSLRHSEAVHDLQWSSLTFVRPLGKGSFGEVGLYKLHESADVQRRYGRHDLVAVKCLLAGALQDEQALADFALELSVLKRLSHSCLVGMVGSGLTPDGSVFLALEAVLGGDLRRQVQGAMKAIAMGKPSPYTDADCLRWVHDIARGLNYLHSRSPLLIHRDLKPEARCFCFFLTQCGGKADSLRTERPAGRKVEREDHRLRPHKSAGREAARVRAAARPERRLRDDRRCGCADDRA